MWPLLCSGIPITARGPAQQARRAWSHDPVITSERTWTPVSRVASLLEETWSPTRPFAEIRAKLSSNRFVTVGKQQVYVEQAGRGEPLVLIHGFGGSSYSWRFVIPHLARRFRVLALDLNGFGFTQRPREPEHYTVEGQERLVLNTLDALEVPSAHFIGHSFGGGLALLVAARHSSRARSLVLVGSVSPNHHQERRQPWARLRPLNYLLLRSFALSRSTVRCALEECYWDPALVTQEVVDSYRERLLVEGLEDAYYGLLAPVADAPPRIVPSQVRQPVLALWGEADKVIPLEEARPLLAALPRVELEIFGRCGHNPMEEQPERFLEQVLPFLQRHRQRAGARLGATLRRWQYGSSGWRRAPAGFPTAAAAAGNNRA